MRALTLVSLLSSLVACAGRAALEPAAPPADAGVITWYAPAGSVPATNGRPVRQLV
jgi:hypothetical protein